MKAQHPEAVVEGRPTLSVEDHAGVVEALADLLLEWLVHDEGDEP